MYWPDGSINEVNPTVGEIQDQMTLLYTGNHYMAVKGDPTAIRTKMQQYREQMSFQSQNQNKMSLSSLRI